jgi:O-methyltransferase
MTAFFALREARRRISPVVWKAFRMHLYDSWQPMSGEYLLESEKLLAGEYDGLDIETTRKNLSEFSDNIEFHPGFIPDSLGIGLSPESLCYLHVDLNSAGPTVDALEFFLPRMQRGSIVVLDDYGFDNYRETRQAVNSLLSHRSGHLLPLPTGGAYYFV